MTPGGILVLSDVFPPRHGGSGRWLWELYRRLSGVRVAVVAGPAPGDAEFDRLAPLPIERWTTSFPSWGLVGRGGARGYLRAARQVRRAVARERPGVLHAGKCLPEGLIARIVQTLDGIPYWTYAHGEELTLARTSRELRFWTAAVLRRAAKVVANSEHTRRLLRDDWGVDENVVVLTPGVDTARFVPAPPDEAARRRLGWWDRRVVLTVGAMQRRKGQDMLIRALPAIRQRCPDVLYVVLGEGLEEDALARLARELGVDDLVRFMRAVGEDALIECYQQCDLFVLPNRQVGWDFEGFGIVLLEAQACARPVVAGASGGTAETIIPGETGFLVPCEAPHRLAETCADLLADPAARARLGARGRQWVVERFDWQVRLRQATSLFGGRAPAPWRPGPRRP